MNPLQVHRGDEHRKIRAWGATSAGTDVFTVCIPMEMAHRYRKWRHWLQKLNIWNHLSIVLRPLVNIRIETSPSVIIGWKGLQIVYSLRMSERIGGGVCYRAGPEVTRYVGFCGFIRWPRPISSPRKTKIEGNINCEETCRIHVWQRLKNIIS